MRRLLLALSCLVLFVAFTSPASACDLDGVRSVSTPIFAGKTIDAGTAYFTNDGCDLIIRAFAENGWKFEEAHAYAGQTPTPLNRGGNPAPGRFPYALNFSSPVTDFEIRIPLSSLGVSIDPRGGRCEEETLWIALHVVVGNGGSGKNSTETGWAFGPSSFGKRWGWEFPYQVQCGRVVDPPPNN